MSFPESSSGLGGMEAGGRERKMETRRQGGRQGRREAGREARKKAGREGGRQGGREGGRQAVREGGKMWLILGYIKINAGFS